MTNVTKVKKGIGKSGWVKLAVAILVAAGALLVDAGYELQRASREHQRFRVRMGQEDLDRQLAALQASEKHAIHLYDTLETDVLLRQLEGRADVEELVLDLTDASQVGLASVATLPRLRKLVLYGGGHIDDAGFEKVAGMSSLQELELRNTRVTNDGLRLLQRLPNLRSLVIFCEPRLGVLNDTGLAHLKDLTKLETLTITGGWASLEGVAQLRRQLANCKVASE